MPPDRYIYLGAFLDRDRSTKAIFYTIGTRRNGTTFLKYADENGRAFDYWNAGRLKIDMVTCPAYLTAMWEKAESGCREPYLHADGSWVPGRKTKGVALRRKILERKWRDLNWIDPYTINGGVVKALGRPINTAHAKAFGWDALTAGGNGGGGGGGDDGDDDDEIIDDEDDDEGRDEYDGDERGSPGLFVDEDLHNGDDDSIASLRRFLDASFPSTKPKNKMRDREETLQAPAKPKGKQKTKSGHGSSGFDIDDDSDSDHEDKILRTPRPLRCGIRPHNPASPVAFQRLLSPTPSVSIVSSRGGSVARQLPLSQAKISIDLTGYEGPIITNTKDVDLTVSNDDVEMLDCDIFLHSVEKVKEKAEKSKVKTSNSDRSTPYRMHAEDGTLKSRPRSKSPSSSFIKSPPIFKRGRSNSIAKSRSKAPTRELSSRASPTSKNTNPRIRSGSPIRAYSFRSESTSRMPGAKHRKNSIIQFNEDDMDIKFDAESSRSAGNDSLASPLRQSGTPTPFSWSARRDELETTVLGMEAKVNTQEMAAVETMDGMQLDFEEVTVAGRMGKGTSSLLEVVAEPKVEGELSV